MNRRHFLKIGALASIAAFAGAKPALATEAPRRCRITVVRRMALNDLQSHYLDEPESGFCPMLDDGQRFEATSTDCCPEGMCPKAWNAMQPEINRLLNGKTGCGDCRGSELESLTCCPDGSRPVIFHLSIARL